MEIEESSKSIGDYLQVLPRRKYTILVSTLCFFFIALVVTLALPSIYRSTATIAIEKQKIPTDFIKSTVVSSADERIMQIRQTVMTVDNINQLIEKHQLYPTKNQDPLILAEKFLADFTFEFLSADVIGKSRGAKIALAFKLGFEHKNPILAQKVASDITNLFLNENIKSRTEGAIETTLFLETEAKQLQEAIQQIETNITQHKAKNSDSLPEFLSSNLAEINRIKIQLELSKSQEQILEQQKITLQTQLAATSPFPVDLTGKSIIPDSLPKLKTDYTNLLSKYSERHPDVIALKYKIDNYKETDVQKNQAIEASNPIYLQLKGQVDMINVQQKNSVEQRNEMTQALKKLEEQVSRTPQVQHELDDLARNLESNRVKYQEISAKYLEAKLAQSLEQEQKSEKFSVLESASIPTKAEKPDRLKVLFIGFAASIVSGIIIGFGIDVIKSGIRGDKEITALTGIPLLIIVPYIQNKNDISCERKRKILFIIFCFIWLICVIITIHHFKPLDILWNKLSHKITSQ